MFFQTNDNAPQSVSTGNKSLATQRTSLRAGSVRYAACLVTLLAIVGCARAQDTKTPTPTPNASEESTGVGVLARGEPSSAVAVEEDDARSGAADADVTVVAFLDFQCAFCAEGFRTLLSLREAYPEQSLRIVFKHMPLEFHEMALPAAIAGQAVMQARGSEAFFNYARLAFENQSSLSYTKLADLAAEAGLPRQLYNDLVGREDTVRRVVQDARLAHQLGVDATPAFYINGRLVPGAQSPGYFRQIIDEELASMSKTRSTQGWKAAYQARIFENMRGSILTALLSTDPDDYRVPVDESPALGNPKAPVTIVMFTDFQCPYCQRAEVTLGLLRKKYDDKLRVVFKHMPLPFHDSARPAALIAQAVYEHRGNEAFFSAAAELFKKSSQLSEPVLRNIGQKHGLTKQQIESALADKDAKLSDRLTRDTDLAEDVLAQGTPHFFINGKRLSGARPIEQFEALIEHGLSRAKELEARGVAQGDIYTALQKDALSPGVPEKLKEPIPEAGSPARGAPDSPVVIHVFSDFECPYCRQGELLLDKLDARFPGKLRIVWHDFPLDFHERARPAARAGREAYTRLGNQGFWQMHERLFDLEGQDAALSHSDILEHGRALGMDSKKLNETINGTSHDSAIDADIELGKSLGIRGTPAYIVGGYMVTGAKPFRFFERLVERSLIEREAPSNEKSLSNKMN